MRSYLIAIILSVSAVFLPGQTLATVVSGRVTTTGGAGIENVDLDFIDRNTNQSISLVNDDTDILGFYAISVPTGDYDVRFKPRAGDRFVAVEMRGVRAEGSSMTMDQELETGWFLSGKVQNTAAVPVVSLDLDLIDIVDGGVIYTAHDNTDALGDYRVVLPAGLYDVEFEPAVGSSLVPVRLEGITLAADTDLGTLTLEQGHHLTGNVLEPGALPAVGVEMMTLDPLSGNEVFNIRNQTDLAGVYDFMVAPGNYDLLLVPAQGAPLLPRLVAGVSLQADLELPAIMLDPGAVASGLVLDPSLDPAEGTDLDMISQNSDIEQFTPHDNADRDGLYSVTVRPGRYDVSFNPPTLSGWAAGGLIDVNLATSMSLPTVQLQVGRTISGTVKDSLGNPLTGVDLDFLIAASGDEIVTNGDNTSVSGSFSIQVPDGTYDVEFNPVDGSGFGRTIILNLVVSGNQSLGTITLPASVPAVAGGITPATGTADGGTLLTVTGGSFQAGVQVTLGGIRLSNVVLINSITIQGTTQTHPVGTVEVVVTNPGASAAVLPSDFTYTPPAADPVLSIHRTGPIETDLLLQWTDTGQDFYTIFRSEDPSVFGTAAQVFDVIQGTSFRDDGASSPTSARFLCYLVQ